jgi:DNA ligase-3
MSDAENGEDGTPQKPFCVEYAASGRAGCKKCKAKIDKGALRVGKLASNPFGDGLMKMWFHPKCMFESFAKQRATTARINDLEHDVEGMELIRPEDVAVLQALMDENPPAKAGNGTPKKAGKKAAGSEDKKGDAKKVDAAIASSGVRGESSVVFPNPQNSPRGCLVFSRP